MIRLIIKGTPEEAAQSLEVRGIAVLSDLKLFDGLDGVAIPVWTRAEVHDCYLEKCKAWFRESATPPFSPGDLLSYTQTALAELGV